MELYLDAINVHNEHVYEDLENYSNHIFSVIGKKVTPVQILFSAFKGLEEKTKSFDDVMAAFSALLMWAMKSKKRAEYCAWLAMAVNHRHWDLAREYKNPFEIPRNSLCGLYGGLYEFVRKSANDEFNDDELSFFIKFLD